MNTSAELYKRAKAYIEGQLAVDRRHGKVVKLSQAKFKALIARVVKATPRIPGNGSGRLRTRRG